MHRFADTLLTSFDRDIHDFSKTTSFQITTDLGKVGMLEINAYV